MQPVSTGLQTAQLELASVPQSGKRDRNLNHQEQIYACIVDLHNQRRVASRQRVAEMLGLKLGIVDSHIKTLKDTGRIIFVVNGIYEPAEQFEGERVMSLSMLPNGLVKIELGDELLALTPSEIRALATLTRGFAMEADIIDSEKQGRNDRSRMERLEDLLGVAVRKVVELERVAHDSLNGGSLFAPSAAAT